jgi:hypothetical protein
MEEQTIDYHLQHALAHLETALNQSVRAALANEVQKKAIGRQWEQFLGEFMGHIRDTGKKSGLNLLGLVSFPRVR